MLAQRIQRNPVAWFVIAAVILVGIGLFASAVLGMGDTALDIPIHDTYFVVAHEHIVLATALLCLVCAAMYWVFSRILHRPLNGTLGLVHAVLTFVGLLGIYFPISMIGLAGAPRRYYEYTEFTMSEGDGWTIDLNFGVTGFAVLFLIGQAILLVNLILTLAKRPSA